MRDGKCNVSYWEKCWFAFNAKLIWGFLCFADYRCEFNCGLSEKGVDMFLFNLALTMKSSAINYVLKYE